MSVPCDRPIAAPARAAAWLGWNFVAVSLLSAFLLFQVQPLISKFILPWFGGCPAVWTTCMLFFQTLLFCGYALAHGLQRAAPPRWQSLIHLGLVAAAVALVALLRIEPAAAWKPADQSLPTWRILVLLTVTVGLPYFALSATSPLVQVWFSRSYPGRSPYRLYAVSNAGSLAALLSYPFFFEPALTLPGQSWLWSAGFLLYAVLCAAGAAAIWRLNLPAVGVTVDGDCPNFRGEAGENGTVPLAPSRGQAPFSAPAGGRTSQSPAAGAAPSMLRRAAWLLLPACASLMLLATTNHVCQDVAVVPLLWVAPLALYLLSFIICFDRPQWYQRGLWAMLALTMILAASGLPLLHVWTGHSLSYLQTLLLCFAALLAICMVCHGELVRLRPQPQRLTEFYLYVAAGGALGGVLVSLVAPVVFPTFLEWQIGLVLAYVLAAVVLLLPQTLGRARLARYLAGLSAAVGLACLGFWLFSQVIRDRPVARVRNFYGVVSVFEYEIDEPDRHYDEPDRYYFCLVHANTRHGEQFIDSPTRNLPTTYYSEDSGVGQALRYLQKQKPRMRVGVIGLGTGTLAAYARPGDDYQFYEINPEVPRLAVGNRYFSFVADARRRGATVEIVMGDARLSLERQPPQHFDLLAIDAFSGDAIPTHLLTREAFDVYRRQLAPGGVIAVHITNTYLRLAPVVRAAAEECRMQVERVHVDDDDENLICCNDWMLVSNNAALLAAIPPAEPEADDALPARLWTDHYSNLFQILSRY